MTSLFQSGNYGATNTDDTTTNGFSVIKLISEAYTLQNNTRIDKKLFLRLNYLSSHNIVAPCNKTLIGIGKNNQCNRMS